MQPLQLSMVQKEQRKETSQTKPYYNVLFHITLHYHRLQYPTSRSLPAVHYYTSQVLKHTYIHCIHTSTDAYIHTSIHTYIHTYIGASIHRYVHPCFTCTNVSTSVSVCVYIYIHTYSLYLKEKLHTYIYIYVCVCVLSMCVYIYIYIYMYTHIYVCVCMYICMSTRVFASGVPTAAGSPECQLVM